MWQIHPITDKNHQEHDYSIADENIPLDGSKDDKSMEEANTQETKAMLHSEEVKQNGAFTRYVPETSEVVEEISSDEGWQEANSKGRSGNTANRKFGRRRPLLAKLRVNSSENYIIRESSYRNDITSPNKGTPKVTPATLSSPGQLKARSSTVKEEYVNHSTRASMSKTSTPAALSPLASKSISYKEVALAPPGTVLKPLLEKAEGDNVKTESEKCNTAEESCQNSVVEAVSEQDKKERTCEPDIQRENSSSELEEGSLSSDQEKAAETNGSKLSAAAEPFSPGMLFMHHHLSSVPITNIYDSNASQGMLADPVPPPPVAARVPCGPRSLLYYRTNYTFRMKHGYSKNHTPIRERSGFGAPRIMNPHAPEFVPRKALQTGETNETSMAENNNLDENISKDLKGSSARKRVSESERSELARQILIGLLVKSAQQNIDSADDESKVSEEKDKEMENSSDAIAKDRAIIKILYTNEGKNKMNPESNGSEEEEKIDAGNNNNGDEGFIVVTKKRKSRQKFTNGVSDVCNQQSICASVL